MNIELIKTRRQTVWGWPAVLNFAMGGTGAGLFLVAAILFGHDVSATPCKESYLLLLAPAFVGLGLLSLTLEAGRPLRAIFLFANLRRSWMSREALALAVFLPVSVLSCFVPRSAPWFTAAVAALGILLCHGFILRQARAIAAWDMPLIPIVFVTSGIASGAGLMIVAWTAADFFVAKPMLAVAAGGLALDALVWVGYVTWPGGKAFCEATFCLRALPALLINIGFFRVVPAGLLVFCITNTAAPIRFLLVFAGCAALAGGFWQKIAVIRRAGVLRSITLEVPVRNKERVSVPAPGDRLSSFITQ